MTNDIYVEFYINFNYFRFSVRFTNDVIVDSTVINFGRIDVTTSTEQDLEITNVRIKLYV